VRLILNCGIAAAIVTLAAAAPAQAQDLFVLENYRPATDPVGTWELETYLNYVAQGPVATDQHLHGALEVDHVLARGIGVAGYLLAARRPGQSPEYAGWRFRTLLVAPERWRLPLNLGFVAEWEHTQPAFSDHRNAIELVPILGLTRGRWDARLNAAMELELASGATETEFEWEPSARLSYRWSKVVDLNLEYFSIWGEVAHFLPVVQQIHQIYPGIDLRLGDDLVWNLGLGLGITSAGNRVTLKTAFEIPLRERDTR
jgi:hypothetical protein